MYNKKVLTGAFLALAITAAATGNVAFAQGNGSDNKGSHADANVGIRGSFGRLIDNLRSDVRVHAERRDDRKNNDEKFDNRQDARATLGLAIVTDVDGDIIYADSFKNDEKTSWIITTDADTRFAIRGDKNANEDVSDIAVGNRISITGTITDNSGSDRTIDATGIVRWNPDNAIAKGTVTSIDADAGTYVLDTKHQGDVTVAIDADAQVNDRNNDGALADIAVGTKLFVKGMWDSALEAIVAAKVRILG